MDFQPTAPPVVAVVVTHGAGPWLEEALGSLSAQDYPDLALLVIDAASVVDPTPRVAAAAPQAYIRRLARNPGYAAASNEVMGMVEGASFFLFCHDDVKLDPDAVRRLVEEAMRSNAGVVGPKLVSWDDPERLLQVGLSVDKTGVPAPLVERGDLDQAQHDAEREVFAVSGGCMLVRADLFAALGGFDPAMTLHGEDVDLCWRAQLVGARIWVAPAARVGHIEALPRRRDDTDRRLLQARHRLRTVLKNYSRLHLARVLPQALVFNVGEGLYAAAAGRWDQVGDLTQAWWWNVRKLGDTRRARRKVQQARQVPDRNVRRLQVVGSARVTAFVRGQLGGRAERSQALAAAGRELADSLGHGPGRAVLMVWLAVAAVLVTGSRELLLGRLPSVGDLVPFPEATAFLRHFASGWRLSGLGSEAPAPAAFSLLGLAGMGAFGAMGILRTLLILGALPLGAVGAWFLARPLGSYRARLVAAVVYLSIPLSYNSLARGRLSGLVAYAALPFLLAQVARATGLSPYAPRPGSSARRIVAFGMLMAVVAALAPSLALIVVVVAGAIVLGSCLSGGALAAGRAFGITIGSVVVAIGLLFPWSLQFLPPKLEWATFAGVEQLPARGLGLGALLRFETGPLGAAPIGWFFLVAAALPLLIGKGWRFSWALRLWTVALACWALAWTGGRGWLPVGLPATEVVLAPAAIALALAVALGMVAFETDLPGYRFGWRQGASAAAAAAVALGTLPVVGAALGGRWHLPDQGVSQSLAWMAEKRADGPFRVLWLGDPEMLPLTGWHLAPGVAYGLSDNGPPDALDLWPAPSRGATRLVGEALAEAGRGGTTNLGRLLAPMAVRYVVAPERIRPQGARTPRPAPDGVLPALAGQLDLRRLNAEPGLVVYENTAWAPERALLSSESATVARRTNAVTADALAVDLTEAKPVLGRQVGPTRFTGTSGAGEVLVSQGASRRWELRVAGRPAQRHTLFGWANGFTVVRAGPGTLHYRLSPLRVVLVVVELALWWLAIRFLVGARRPGRRGRGPRHVRSRGRGRAEVEASKSEEGLGKNERRLRPTSKAGRVQAIRLARHRISALTMIIALVGIGGFFDRTERPAPMALAAALGRVMPLGPPQSALSSSWYCAGATAASSPQSFANGTVIVANPGRRPVKGTVTFTPSDAEQSPKTIPLEVTPGAVQTLRHQDTITATYAAALVRLEGGGAVVEHAVSGPQGSDVAPCASSPSDRWYFADGATTKGATSVLALYNPFPEDAVVDLSFSTDKEKEITPPTVQSLVIKGRRLLIVNVGEHVRRRNVVSTSVIARSGRLVADRIQAFDGTDGRRGLALVLGAPSPGRSWYFPESFTADETKERFEIYNPSTTEAQLLVDLLPEAQGAGEGARSGQAAKPAERVESAELAPLKLTVPARGRTTLEAEDEDRIPKKVGHGVVIRSVNGVEVVVERSIEKGLPAARNGLASTMGARLAAQRWAFAAGSVTDQVDERVIIMNPGRTVSVVRVATLVDGGPQTIERLDRLRLAPGRRLSLRLADYVQRPQLPLVVTSSQPVVVERGLSHLGDPGISLVMGIPLRDERGWA